MVMYIVTSLKLELATLCTAWQKRVITCTIMLKVAVLIQATSHHAAS